MSWATGRFGLRGQMTASYVLVTAAAMLLAEAVILGVVFPQALAVADQPTLVRITASAYAKAASGELAFGRQLPTDASGLDRMVKPIRATDDANDGGAMVPIDLVERARPDPATDDVAFVLLLTPGGRVRASSYPGRYPAGAGAAALPPSASSGLRGPQEGRLATPAGEALWAAVPIIHGGQGVTWTPKAVAGALAAAKEQASKGQVVGSVYVQVLASEAGPSPLAAVGPALRRAWPALEAGLVLLVVFVLPVGVVFGLLTTGRLTRRLRRLATAHAAVAAGDLDRTLPVTGTDEVAQLERGFNRMAGQLATGIAVERQLAGANARLAERARIARELHDAISQSLFSLGMQAGGLRRALPAGSALAGQVAAMESTVTRMSQEMQALLLELRPAALEEAGLVPALEELCRAYQARLGVTVEADLTPVELSAAAEHTILRFAQEALTNAVRHADPSRVVLRLAERDGQVEVAVTDDGHGFDPADGAARRGIGLASMRERVEELGGAFELRAATGHGTTVRALLPREAA